MDQIKPNATFVNELTELAQNDNPISHQNHMFRYAIIAASVMLCILVGGLGIHFIPSVSQEDMNDHLTGQVHAQKDTEMTTGTLVNANKIPSSILSILNDETNQISDEKGDLLSDKQRRELLVLLDQCIKSEDKQASGDVINSFSCADSSTPKTIMITVYEDYVKIDHTLYAIQK